LSDSTPVVTLYVRPLEVHPFHVFLHERAIKHHFRRRPSRNPDIPRTETPGELVAVDIYGEPNDQPYGDWTMHYANEAPYVTRTEVLQH
jgi:hypothetical protein